MLNKWVNKIDNLAVENKAFDEKYTNANNSLNLKIDEISDALTKAENLINGVPDLQNKMDDLSTELRTITRATKNDSESYVYSLLDIESDFLKLHNFLDNSTKLTSNEIELLKERFTELNEDISSISIRTNKLILAADDANKEFKGCLNSFQDTINILNEKAVEFNPEYKYGIIDTKTEEIISILNKTLVTTENLNNAFTFLADWVDATGNILNEMQKNISNIDELKDVMNELRQNIKTNQDQLLDNIAVNNEKLSQNIQTNQDQLLNNILVNNEKLSQNIQTNQDQLLDNILVNNEKLSQNIQTNQDQLLNNILVNNEKLSQDIQVNNGKLICNSKANKEELLQNIKINKDELSNEIKQHIENNIQKCEEELKQHSLIFTDEIRNNALGLNKLILDVEKSIEDFKENDLTTVKDALSLLVNTVEEIDIKESIEKVLLCIDNINNLYNNSVEIIKEKIEDAKSEFTKTFKNFKEDELKIIKEALSFLVDKSEEINLNESFNNLETLIESNGKNNTEEIKNSIDELLKNFKREDIDAIQETLMFISDKAKEINLKEVIEKIEEVGNNNINDIIVVQNNITSALKKIEAVESFFETLKSEELSDIKTSLNNITVQLDTLLNPYIELLDEKIGKITEQSNGNFSELEQLMQIKIEEQSRHIANLEDKIDLINNRFDEVNERYERLLETVNERTDNSEIKDVLNYIVNQIADINNNVVQIQNNQQYNSEIVNTIMQKTEACDESIIGNANAIETVNEKVMNLESNITKLVSYIEEE